MRFALEFGGAPLADGEPLPPEDDCASGYIDALECAYRKERSAILRSVARLASVEDAEDAIQQTFLRCAEKRYLGAIEHPRAYLKLAVVNLLRTNYRVATRRSAKHHVLIDDLDVADGDAVSALEARDRLRRIEDAVAKLRPLTRQIFLARRVHGYSLAEICAQTGLSQKGVERHMGIAIKKLGQHLHSHD